MYTMSARLQAEEYSRIKYSRETEDNSKDTFDRETSKIHSMGSKLRKSPRTTGSCNLQRMSSVRVW